MNTAAILALLAAAATLEVGADALMRAALHHHGLARAPFLAAGILVLAAYGLVVNLGPWDFGRVLGVYVVLFFLVAQLVNWLGFGLRPSPAILLGGALICAGGLVMTLWQ
ncbi:hypothetical protein FE249_16735 [Acidiphilium multivorum]|uniref:hypothetical protein n=1 Tax=Acidiphilium multivorum TaxID=62140 RepID=UPI001F4C373C|nr:hypothetical protein [Acidiphilium multivorum]UNC15753.1 hypothetical protein FE249_16735 [Acidiphilium multivorum]